MKTPFSILCISDLHFNNEKLDPVKKLGEDLLRFTKEGNHAEKLQWLPSYLVIAGDIANKGNLDYSQPTQHINDLLQVLGLSRDHVILVPGNHDKNTKGIDLLAYRNEIKLFEQYQKHESAGCVQEFHDYYANKFKPYIDFGKQYLSDPSDVQCKEYQYQKPELLLPMNNPDFGIRLLSGVRHFKEDSLCFVIVNTEWLYIPPSSILKEKCDNTTDCGIEKKVRGIKRLLSIKENCKLCVPLINDAYNLIKKDYKDCTIVTVMHRDFKDLTWFENNHTNLAQKNPIQQIEAFSDIILTGHEHTVTIENPSYMKNKIQHFKLGSTGRDPYESSEEPVRTACLIRINPASEQVEMLTASYDGINNAWSFYENEEIFPLRQKYTWSEELAIDNTGKRIIIKAKDSSNEIVIKEIRAHFDPNDEKSLSFCIFRVRINDLEKDLNNAYLKWKEKTKPLFIVIYRIIEKTEENKHIDDRIDNFIYQFEKKHVKDCLCNRIIIRKVDVIIPNLV